MFQVTGMIDSVPYLVGVHDQPVEGELYGCVMGSTHATSLLALHEGEQTSLTPTHSSVTLSLSDPASVLVFLTEHTHVIAVEGDAPDVNGPLIEGAIY